MGRVYLGGQSSLGREVALKISKVDPSHQKQLAQLYHEAQITAALDHPNILPMYLLARDGEGRPIQVMKRVQGTTWATLLNEPQHPLWERLDCSEGRLHFHLEVLAQVALAVGYAHDRGVIHRDLKPDNVMIGDFGEVYVLDWGVALATSDLSKPQAERVFLAQEACGLASALVGTPVYMSPEMGRQEVERLGPTADVFLLGAILYEILTGCYIRSGDDLEGILRMITAGREPEVPEWLSEEFQTLLKLSLCSEPEERISDAQSFRRLLIHATRTDRADQVRKRADQARLKLAEALKGPIESEDDVLGAYDEARLDYRASLEMWPSSVQARRGLDSLHELLIEHLIQEGALMAAKRTLTKLSVPNEALTRRIEEAEQERASQAADHAKLQRWHHHHDIQRSRSLRVIVSVVGLIIFGFGSVIIELLQQSGLIVVRGRDEVLISFVLSLAAFILIAAFAFQRRYVLREANAVFGRFIGYLGVISLIGTSQRYISWQLGLEPAQILHQEMPLIALGCFGLSAITGQRHFIIGGLAFTLAMFVSLSSPGLTKGTYACAMITVWLGALISTKSEEKVAQL